MYESPEVDKLNSASPTGINDYIYMDSIAVGEMYLFFFLVGISFEAVFVTLYNYPDEPNKDSKGS